MDARDLIWGLRGCQQVPLPPSCYSHLLLLIVRRSISHVKSGSCESRTVRLVILVITSRAIAIRHTRLSSKDDAHPRSIRHLPIINASLRNGACNHPAAGRTMVHRPTEDRCSSLDDDHVPSSRFDAVSDFLPLLPRTRWLGTISGYGMVSPVYFTILISHVVCWLLPSFPW